MPLRFRLRRYCIAVGTVLALSAATAQARDLSGVFVFGDSLSDAGAYTPLVAVLGVPTANRFTSNPGQIWAETLAASYGRGATAAYAVNLATGVFGAVSTGSNFAVGGAQVNAQTGVFPASPAIAANIPPVSTQVGALLSRGTLDDKALYAVWAGANDIITQMGIVGASGVSALTSTAMDLASQVARLKAAGAKNIVVIGVPDIGASPFAAAGGATQIALASQLSASYNTALVQTLANSGALFLDAAQFMQSITANPSAYGITNTTIPACGAARSLGCLAAANGRLFADGVHPSTLGHQLISDWVRAMLEGSGHAGLLATLPVRRSGAQWRAVDGRMRDFQNFGEKGGGLFVSMDRASGSIDATENSTSASGHTNALMVGYQRALHDQLLLGATFGYEDVPFNLGGNAGYVKYDAWHLAAFASYKAGPWYANGIASHGRLDYDTMRNFTLGPAALSASGDTTGRQSGFRFQTGYLISSGKLVHGPLAGIDFESVKIDAYNEKTGGAAALRFGDQKRNALRSRIGYQLAGEDQWGGMRVRPHAQLSYEYQHRKDERDTLVGAGGDSMMSVSTANRTGGYGVLTVGATMRIAKDIDLGVGLSGTIDQPGARNNALQVTLSAAL